MVIARCQGPDLLSSTEFFLMTNVVARLTSHVNPRPAPALSIHRRPITAAISSPPSPTHFKWQSHRDPRYMRSIGSSSFILTSCHKLRRPPHKVAVGSVRCRNFPC